ncbi:Carboxypeptidase N subunit 2 [Chionoecetes opilio]|uniref:Carboxypeptidase N subunit 2 n=1 Tax=Chionoecetes opilio TaxID=41210 RepID=A0A8J4Y8L9_CHIOP|nr:Carboxypeptidase N subunit 2 [Chionoecetes opilio]
MAVRQWLVVGVAVVVAGRGEAFMEWFWSTPDQDLCQGVCECPQDLVMARQRGIDCVQRNITAIQDGLDIPKVFPSITFARNHIKTLSPATFASSSSLLTLDLSENDLESLPGGAFTPLMALSTLNLRNNNISALDPEAFVGLHNLTRLDLSYNGLTSLPEGVFGDLTSLQELYIGFNPLVNLNGSLLAHTPSLKTLDLSQLGLQHIPPSLLMANLSQLQRVSLAYNELRVVPSRALRHLGASLLHLDLSGNLFTSLDAYSFDGLENLRSLTLEQMFRLVTIDAYAFGDLTRLETLVLRYMPWMESIDSKAFHRIVEGKESSLRLADFTFSYSSLHTLPEHLLPWEHLRYISLHLNHWRCDCHMRWVKNATELLRQTGKTMITMFVFLVVVMTAGLSASLATIALLVYWRRGWLCRRPKGAYSSVRRSGSTITITEEVDNTSEA